MPHDRALVLNAGIGASRLYLQGSLGPERLPHGVALVVAICHDGGGWTC
jgi:hypothetical protein